MVELEVESTGYIVRSVDTGEEIFFQVDWDFPGLASTFGWSPCTDCSEGCKGATDGTVPCKQRSVAEMIEEATVWLDNCDGDTAANPGYFT